MSIISRRIQPVDDFIFNNPVDKFRYLRSATLYANTEIDMAALLAASTEIIPSTGGSGIYQGDFVMPGGTFQYLYFIYDYRNAYLKEFCYSNISADDACCNCAPGANVLAEQCRADGVVNQIVASNAMGAIVGDFVEITDDGFLGTCIFKILETTSDAATQTVTAIRPDILDCSEACGTYSIENVSGGPITLSYVSCTTGFLTSLDFTTGQTWPSVCANWFDLTFPNTDYTITYNFCDCLV